MSVFAGPVHDNGGQMNFLIEGDNLASLKLLEKTHKGKIKMIYIDIKTPRLIQFN